jgi:tetratricopeptide (TPR) repeat protein
MRFEFDRGGIMPEALILSRLKRRVEVTIGALSILAAASGAAWAIFAGSPAAHAANAPDLADEGDEPEPWPQVEIPAHSDYSEARALLAKRKWEEAAIVLRAVLKKNPAFYPGAIDLARALVYLGRREEALTLLAQVISRQPPGTRKTALVARVGVISRMFLTQKTFQAYQDGLNLVVQQKYRSARERFEKALEAEPDNLEVLARIGECLVLEGDVDSAAERLRLARRLNPYEPEIGLWLGRALHQRGELSQALEQLRFAYDALAGSERAPLWYAEALVSSGNRKGALQVLEADTSRHPFHLSAVMALARLRAEGARERSDAMWAARRDLQAALSRLPQYDAGEGRHSEGELGIELYAPGPVLKADIGAMLAQLDGRLKEPAARHQDK